MKIAPVVALLVLGAAGCGGGTPTRPTRHPSGSKITLDLKAGQSARLSACGSAHHYTVYPRGRPSEYAGAVDPVPHARWKVKLKLKACRAGAFVEVQKVEPARDKHTGRYRGTLPALPRGNYFVRASLYENGRAVARSDKSHFAVR